MSTWEQVLAGALAVGVAFYFWPGVKRTIEEGERATERDWAGFVWPIFAVVLFVILLAVLARGEA